MRGERSFYAAAAILEGQKQSADANPDYSAAEKYARTLATAGDIFVASQSGRNGAIG